jgi:ribonuclease HI
LRKLLLDRELSFHTFEIVARIAEDDLSRADGAFEAAVELLEAYGHRDTDGLVLFTDESCSGNPGPGGIGVVGTGGSRGVFEVSKSVGIVTNSQAELLAVQQALQEVPEADRTRPITLYTDSQYVLGVLTNSYRIRANRALIAAIFVQLEAFPHIKLAKVPGHEKVWGNERADELARAAST